MATMTDMIKTLRAMIPETARTARKRAWRSTVRLWLDMTRADHDKRLRAERRFRGREQYRLLRRSDAVVVSYAKSGRTWLRVMISRLYQQIYDIPDDTVLEFDNFHHMNRHIPRLFFTHDEYIREFTGNTANKADFHDKRVLLMVRDPRDVVCRSFFTGAIARNPGKASSTFTRRTTRTARCSISFSGESSGLPRVIDFMNGWAREIDKMRAHEIVRYEDMRDEPQACLTRVARFLDIPASDDHITGSGRLCRVRKHEAKGI